MVLWMKLPVKLPTTEFFQRPHQKSRKLFRENSHLKWIHILFIEAMKLEQQKKQLASTAKSGEHSWIEVLYSTMTVWIEKSK